MTQKIESAKTSEMRLEQIPISKILVHRIRRVGSPGELSMLYDSIKDLGLIEPIVVVPSKLRDRWELVAGYRRLITYTLVHGQDSKIPAIVRSNASDEWVKRARVQENVERKGFSESEEKRILVGGELYDWDQIWFITQKTSGTPDESGGMYLLAAHLFEDTQKLARGLGRGLRGCMKCGKQIRFEGKAIPCDGDKFWHPTCAPKGMTMSWAPDPF